MNALAFLSPDTAATIGYVVFALVLGLVGLVVLVVVLNVALALLKPLMPHLRPWTFALPCWLVSRAIHQVGPLCLTLPDGSSAVGWGSRVRGRAFRSVVVKRAGAAWWTWPLPAFVLLLLVVLLRRPMPLGSLVVYPLQRVENP